MFMGRCFLLGLGLILAGWRSSLPAQDSPGSRAAVLVEKENIVDAQVRGATWKAAPVGIELEISDKLRTGEFSRATVRFTDLSMLRLDELTTIEISPPIATNK